MAAKIRADFPLVQLLSSVAVPNTNRARRTSRRPHFLVTPRFWAPSLPTSSAAAVLNLLETAKERLDGLVCALALITRTNQEVFGALPQRRRYRHRAIIRSRARSSGIPALRRPSMRRAKNSGGKGNVDALSRAIVNAVSS